MQLHYRRVCTGVNFKSFPQASLQLNLYGEVNFWQLINNEFMYTWVEMQFFLQAKKQEEQQKRDLCLSESLEQKINKK